MNLVSEIMRFATPGLVDKLASSLGINSGMAKMALTYAVPALLSAFAGKAATPSGATALFNAVKGTDSGMLGNLENLIGGAGQSQMSQAGSSILGSLLGQSGVNDIASGLTKNTGLGGAAAASLLPLVGQMVLGGIGKAAPSNNASDLASLLKSQAGNFTLPNMPKAAMPAAPQVDASGGMGMLKWAIPVLALGALGWYFLGNRTAEVPAPAVTQTETTAPAVSLVVDGLDVGKTVTDTLGGLTTTFGTITDAATATAALPQLTTAATTIDGLTGAVGKMDAAQKTGLGALISAALPAVKTAAEGVLAKEGVGPIAKPVLDGLFAKLEGLAK